jgi:hypothetical protein
MGGATFVTYSLALYKNPNLESKELLETNYARVAIVFFMSRGVFTALVSATSPCDPVTEYASMAL